MPKPVYAHSVLGPRLHGLAQAMHKPNATLRTDYLTYACFAPDDVIKVRLGTFYFAEIRQGSVTVKYKIKSNVLHRRMNEVLHHTGWAVINRNSQWTLLRRDDKDGTAHPFPPEVAVTVEPNGSIWYDTSEAHH